MLLLREREKAGNETGARKPGGRLGWSVGGVAREREEEGVASTHSCPGGVSSSVSCHFRSHVEPSLERRRFFGLQREVERSVLLPTVSAREEHK